MLSGERRDARDEKSLLSTAKKISSSYAKNSLKIGRNGKVRLLFWKLPP